MTAPDRAWLALGAGVAAPVRYRAGAAGRSTDRRPFPTGTFAVNCLACLLLGIALQMRVPLAWVQSLVAIGFCGALSTWSTLAWEVTGFVRTGGNRLAVLCLGATVVAGVALAWAGTEVGRPVW
ncbi:fluoride efflux transporter FluC [Streptomyces sp. MAR4 CNY-716]